MVIKIKSNKISLGVKYEDSKEIKVYDNNLFALKDIISIENFYELICNTTNTKIIKNDYFTYIPKEIYNYSLNYNKLFCNEKEFIAYFNINNVRNPEYETINIKPIVNFELSKGYLFITKLLENIKIL